MKLEGRTAVVTGGSRGLGLGVAEALVAHGAKVKVVARGAEGLRAARSRLGVETIEADITDADAARRIVAGARPDVLVLNAGATPPMQPIDQMSWADFTATWETDVKGGLYWVQAALNLPLAAGSRVLLGSSGAAVNGSPMSGGYGGAKRMLWLMARYANAVSAQKNLGIRFQAIVPRQMIGGTGVGDAGSLAYARAQGIEQQAFLDRFGAPMPPKQYGELVVKGLTAPQYETALALAFKGDTGVTILEEEAA